MCIHLHSGLKPNEAVTCSTCMVWSGISCPWFEEHVNRLWMTPLVFASDEHQRCLSGPSRPEYPATVVSRGYLDVVAVHHGHAHELPFAFNNCNLQTCYYLVHEMFPGFAHQCQFSTTHYSWQDIDDRKCDCVTTISSSTLQDVGTAGYSWSGGYSLYRLSLASHPFNPARGRLRHEAETGIQAANSLKTSDQPWSHWSLTSQGT